MNNVPHLVNHS